MEQVEVLKKQYEELVERYNQGMDHLILDIIRIGEEIKSIDKGFKDRIVISLDWHSV